jgi:hypothetical protein
VLFGKRREGAPGGAGAPAYPAVEPEMYVVSYESMLKGNKVLRRGKPIRQVAIVVEGTVKLVTSGDRVDRRTYDALIGAGVLPPANLGRRDDHARPEALPDPEGHA